MRPLDLDEKKTLYNFTKTVLLVSGILLTIYGGWFLVSQFITAPHNPEFWFGLFPGYIGSMMILISLAMKLEWF
ncbi:MAG: hypothetical protein ACREBS_08200, partial [Nitrososphaerales archaeon]